MVAAAARAFIVANVAFGLDYDAGVSKEIIPVVFSREGVKIALPELEIVEPAAALKPVMV